MSNNKQSMKLYTEEQVNELRRALRDIAQWDEDLEDDWEDAGNRAMDALRCFDKLTPIEIPSDEEIDKESEVLYPINKGGSMWMPSRYDIDKNNRQEGFVDGAKWMRDKIQGGNK